MPVVSWVLGIALLLGSCGEREAFVDADSDTCRAHGSITDLSRESHSQVDYLHRWATTDGCAVRFDVLVTRRGEDSCGGERVADLLMGTPLGTSTKNSEPRQFVRDPAGILVDRRTSQAFDPNARLPPGAKDTGFRQDGVELWMRPDRDGLAYLVDGDRVEAWPLGRAVAGCA